MLLNNIACYLQTLVENPSLLVLTLAILWFGYLVFGREPTPA